MIEGDTSRITGVVFTSKGGIWLKLIIGSYSLLLNNRGTIRYTF